MVQNRLITTQIHHTQHLVVNQASSVSNRSRGQTNQITQAHSSNKLDWYYEKTESSNIHHVHVTTQ